MSFEGKWTVAATVTEKTIPPCFFALSLSGFAHQSTCGRHAPALQKHLAWRGRRGQKPQCLLCGLPFFFLLLSLSCLGWKLCLRIFCSIWVGSKCLSKSRVEAPSRAAQFDLLVLKSQRDISVHLKSSISQQRHSRYLIETEINTLYICVNTKGVAVYIWNK